MSERRPDYLPAAPIVLTFAWPADTSLNARLHWAKRAQAAEACHVEGMAAAREARDAMPGGEYQVVYTFHPPNKTRRDLDNFIARMKKHQDGIFSAWGLDDCCIRRVVGEWGEVSKPGRVVVTVTRLGEE